MDPEFRKPEAYKNLHASQMIYQTNIPAKYPPIQALVSETEKDKGHVSSMVTKFNNLKLNE